MWQRRGQDLLLVSHRARVVDHVKNVDGRDHPVARGTPCCGSTAGRKCASGCKAALRSRRTTRGGTATSRRSYVDAPVKKSAPAIAPR